MWNQVKKLPNRKKRKSTKDKDDAIEGVVIEMNQHVLLTFSWKYLVNILNSAVFCRKFNSWWVTMFLFWSVCSLFLFEMLVWRLFFLWFSCHLIYHTTFFPHVSLLINFGLFRDWICLDNPSLPSWPPKWLFAAHIIIPVRWQVYFRSKRRVLSG